MRRFLAVLVVVVLVLAGTVVGFAEDNFGVFDLSSFVRLVSGSYPSVRGNPTDNVLNYFFDYDPVSKVATVDFKRTVFDTMSDEIFLFLSDVELNPQNYFVLLYDAPNSINRVYFVRRQSPESVVYIDERSVSLLDSYDYVYFSYPASLGTVTSFYKFGNAPGSVLLKETNLFFIHARILDGSYLSHSGLSVAASSSLEVFDKLYPVSSFRFLGGLAERHEFSIDYQYLDGTTAAPSYISNHEVGKEYVIASPAVVGHTPNQLVVSGAMPETDLHFTVTYGPTPYALLVDFLDSGGKQVARSARQTVLYNEPYMVDCPAVVGYAPEQEAVSGIMPASDLTLSAAYTTNVYTLTVSYVKQDGSSAFAPVVLSVPYGEAYSVVSPALEGFEADRGTVSGMMPARDIVRTVTYLPPRPPHITAMDNALQDFSSSVSGSILTILGICICLLSVVVGILTLIQIIKRFLGF